MTTTRTTSGLRSNITCALQQTSAAACRWVSLPHTAQCKFLGLHYIALDEIVEHPGDNDAGKSRFNLRDILLSLWDILFPDRGRETYRRLEGEDVTPITAYKSGNRYYVADEGNRLATARYLGQAYILAQIWELP